MADFGAAMSQDDPGGLGPSPPSVSGSDHQSTAAQRKAGKRDRVALACQRCKTRKQKCDGNRPACASCARLSLKCVYIIPLVPAAAEKKLYIKALEQRVAELEGALTSVGHSPLGTDHLRQFGSISSSSGQPSSSSAAQSQHNIISGGPPGSQALPQDHLAGDSDNGNELMLAVRDLSLSASGHYIGASSNITIGRFLSSVVQSQKPVGSSPYDETNAQDEDDDPAPKSIYSTNAGEMLGVQLLSPSVASRLIQGWFRHIHTRYPCIHSARLLHLHENRENLADDYENTIMHIIYAVSGRWLESAGEMGHFFSDQHYDLAFEEMESILRLRDSRTIDYLLLMALYCTRAPRDPGAWTYVGAAMRLCIELGLHRRPRRQTPSVESEMNKRRFWTAYFLDRDVSIASGRPPSISDHDIDADMPLDVPEENLDDEVVRQASMRSTEIPASPPNSLTPFIHRLRLKKIESEIQHVVYRVDQSDKTPDPVIDAFLDRLHAWRDAIPYEARNFVYRHDIAYDGLEFYTIHYHRCVRFLLYPQLAETPVTIRYLNTCADACAGIISDYRRLHQVFPVGFSALSIQSVFIAGLNLMYCAWLAPPNRFQVEAPLTDCQLLLYIVAERYPSAKKYRDIFERLKATIMAQMAQGKHGPRNPFSLDPNLQEGFANMQGQWDSQMGADFNFMINKMTGNVATTPPFNMAATAATVSTPAPLLGMAPDMQQQQPQQHQTPQTQPQQQAIDLGQYQQVWPGMPQNMQNMQNMNPMNPMGNLYQ